MSATLVHQNFSTFSPHDPHAADESADLLREAAVLGPGFFGVRRDGTDAERLALARRFADLGERTPVYLLARSEWIDRRARLLVAGAYEELGLTLTTAHLAAIVRGFVAPLPILIEHSDSPIGLGYVTSVELDGDALDAVLTFSLEADALLRACGANTLSVGLSSDLSRLAEVSLVRHPQAIDARLFCAGPHFRAVLEESRTDRPPFELSAPRGAGESESDPDLERLLREGRLLAEQVESARKLLAAGRLRFGADAVEIRRHLIDLLEAGPERRNERGEGPGRLERIASRCRDLVRGVRYPR